MNVYGFALIRAAASPLTCSGQCRGDSGDGEPNRSERTFLLQLTTSLLLLVQVV